MTTSSSIQNLKDWFINNLHQAVMEDITARGHPSYAFTRFKNTVLTVIFAIVPDDPETHPLDLSTLDSKAFSS